MTTGTIEFDQNAAHALEKAYLTRDVIAQRGVVLEALDPRPGEAVLDIGQGPGLLLEEIARRVGAQGRAVGVDLSETMSAHARRR